MRLVIAVKLDGRVAVGDLGEACGNLLLLAALRRGNRIGHDRIRKRDRLKDHIGTGVSGKGVGNLCGLVSFSSVHKFFLFFNLCGLPKLSIKRSKEGRSEDGGEQNYRGYFRLS